MAAEDKRALWRERIAQWQHSGLSRRAWCARHGINPHTLDYWRRRLPTSAGVLPIAMVPEAPLSGPMATVVELSLPGAITLRVALTADAAQVVRWVQALRAC